MCFDGNLHPRILLDDDGDLVESGLARRREFGAVVGKVDLRLERLSDGLVGKGDSEYI